MIRSFLVVMAASAFLAMPAAAQDVRLSGPDGTAVIVTAAEIAALPRQRLSLTAHGVTRVYEGPTLASVLDRIDAPLGERLRGSALTTFAIVRAADGYAVVLSLAEIDPALSPSAVILADRADGLSLSADEGPLRIIVEDDARPARSVRQVTAIEVRRP